jgi:hypothetical protein
MIVHKACCSSDDFFVPALLFNEQIMRLKNSQTRTGCLLTQLLLFIIITIIIIDNYPVDCSFSATLNLIFAPTRIVMKNLNTLNTT